VRGAWEEVEVGQGGRGEGRVGRGEEVGWEEERVAEVGKVVGGEEMVGGEGREGEMVKEEGWVGRGVGVEPRQSGSRTQMGMRSRSQL
jgi:hypothetical protein